MQIAGKHNAKNFTSNKIANNNHISLLKIGEWGGYFTDAHKRRFIELYGDLLIKLNYEKDDNW